uniref:Zinc transporter ZIP11 n=1 Tax=Globodera rostochiensis TaxID=31243 RepID=A0A914HNY6_GLORO
MIQNWHPVYQALIASLFTWGLTALGAALVQQATECSLVDASLGFAGGVMTAASFWSLLTPAIEISQSQMSKLAFIPVTVGFALGAFFVSCMIPRCVNAELKSVLPEKAKAQMRKMQTKCKLASKKQSWNAHSETRRNGPPNSAQILPAPKGFRGEEFSFLIVAVTMQNFPEGLAVGVGFGGVGKTPSATFEKAFNLAFGIGLENFPEGLAVSLPLAAFGYSKWKAFFYGQLSGIVEPIAALIGASLALIVFHMPFHPPPVP